MPSQLNVDTIKGQTTAGSVTIQGEGTKTTNLQQGLAKAWVNLNGISTAAYRDSFNSSSLTDNATGDYTHTVTNNFGNINYVPVGLCNGNNAVDSINTYNIYYDVSRMTPTSSAFATQNQSYNSTALDNAWILISVNGDLA